MEEKMMEEEKNGREREKEEEREQRGKEKREKGKWKGKEGKILEENLKLKEERFFFFLSFHFLKPLKFVWGVPKWKFWGKIF